jgi:2-polyprenyl-3-methyl-5-hydroxy-6-metoxy-1,4-benzoquinol methylase
MEGTAVSGSTRDHYGRLAASYDEIWAAPSQAFNGWMSERILERLDLRADDRVVDLGCGTGIFSTALATQAHEVVCADPSPEMLAQLPKTGGALVPVQASAEDVASGGVRLPYDHVDAVLIKEALHHVRDREAVAAGLARLLAPGGRLLVVTLPTVISYPLFRRALEVFAERQPDPADIAGAMQAAGLAAEVTYETYRREFARDRYVAMVRNRHMSLLSEFDDAELEDGIREIEREHPEEVLEFDDRFAFVLGRHP